MHQEDLAIVNDSTPSKIQTCFKDLRRVTRLLIRHARNLRRLGYGKALLRVFVKKPSVALKSTMRIAEGETNTTFLPTNLSEIWDETTDRLITTLD